MTATNHRQEASEAERRLLAEWNRTDVDYPDVTVHDLVEQQVRRTPDAIALVAGSHRLTYRELDERANRLAHHLRSCGVRRESLVAVHLERSAELVVALLAVLKAGGAYLPLDPDHPAARLSSMVDDARPVLVLTHSGLPPGGPDRVCVDTLDLARYPLTAPEPLATTGDLAYVIYTSGSTGRPKGALNTHRAVSNRLQWTQQRFGLDASDAVLQKTPCSFDVSVWEFFWPLLAGARLVLAEPGAHLDPVRVAGLIRAHDITTVHFVPSMLWGFLEAAGSSCVSLRRVLCSGEALTPALQRRFHRQLPAELHNLYGPTEAAIDVTHWHCRAEDAGDTVPIGRPIANVRVHVLNDRLGPVPIGEAGEIYLGGTGVGRGYLRRPELTRERFVPDPFDPRPGARLYRTGDLGRFTPGGVLEYLGRTDLQVKVHGVRVEPGEIESALADHPAVQTAVVSVPPGESRLVAHVVPDPVRAGPVRRLARWDRTGTTAGHRRHRLPDGTLVFHHAAAETEFLYREIFEQRVYLRHGVRLGADACVFDVGANIGMFSLFASRFGDGVRVFSFEPVPEISELLRLNTELHGLNAVVGAYGLGDAEGEVPFTYYPGVSIISGQFADPALDRRAVRDHVAGRAGTAQAEQVETVLDEALRPRRVTCRVRTLSSVLREHGITRVDLLKIDVERAELAVLAGIRDEDWPKIRQVAAEVHDAGDRLGTVLSLLALQGFRTSVDRHDTGLATVYAVRPDDEVVPARASTGPWSDPALLSSELRRHLLTRLPPAMVPGAVVVLDDLPLTANGKLDRASLPPPPPTGVVPPRDEVESLLTQMWRDLLGRPEIGVTDDFFALGGDSLVATTLVAQIRKATGRSLPVSALFRDTTVAQLADLVRRTDPDEPWPVVVPLVSSPGAPHLVLVHPVGGHLLGYRELTAELGGDFTISGLQAPGLDGRAAPLRSIADFAALYASLVREACPDAPIHLAGWSFGGVVAYEMARLLDAGGTRIGSVTLFDPRLSGAAEDAKSPVHQANVTALAAWNPIPHHGQVVLVRPRLAAPESTVEQRWLAVLREHGLARHTVPGDHHTMLSGAGAAACAELLRSVIVR
ncbi:amino acid adenylation domain-containing protein [Lentzea sp.]|uniref:non-ribosomal peptide synthetase n=1 Tax=Lentzea sp. TaxID=56099 RepID=UPI002B8C6EBB|nr:amino acid adenylation domain-containing protein [Lentzea sp.]HUQ56446.1 amino acid adenylation domain-containing protein [Lentzea sp.]